MIWTWVWKFWEAQFLVVGVIAAAAALNFKKKLLNKKKLKKALPCAMCM